ncbi:MAG: hypothetical protein GF418_03780 [Chitinivibrionales bacterium]|nr:hypothetical protein [Chitinivibrionales bacterium]MBD3394725.1 hypothetical protein [Chitinivibrionales bacterium]
MKTAIRIRIAAELGTLSVSRAARSRYLTVSLVCAFAAAAAPGGRAQDSSAVAFTLSASFSETMVMLHWEPLDSVHSYNVYADYGKGFVRANPIPVSSRTQFAFAWIEEEGRRRRVVKGNSVSLYVAALAGVRCAEDASRCSEVARSTGVATRYFEGFAEVESRRKLRKVLVKRQSVSRILASGRAVPRDVFLREYPRLTASVVKHYRERIDPQDKGACVPFSTIVSKYFSSRGVECYRAQGRFITQFHSFNIILVDSSEYVLDFTADQFLPGSSPVFIPRNNCFIDSTGAPTDSPQGRCTKMYRAEQVFAPRDLRFTDTEEAALYRAILDSLLRE